MDAVVSLISGGRGFLLGAIGQISLIKQHSDKPAILLVERSKYTCAQHVYLERIGWQVKIVDPLRSKWTKFAATRWPNTFTKLRLWELTEYATVLYMDADAYPFSSLSVFDEFSPRILAATHHPNCKQRFRSGMMIVRPDMNIMEELTGLLQQDPIKNGAKLGDQGLLNIAFRDRWERLPFASHTVDWGRRIRTVTVGHLRPKPWEKGKAIPRKMRPYTVTWEHAYSSTIAKYGPVPAV